MAVDRSKFTEKISTGIKSDKDCTIFYFNFKIDGKTKQKVLDYSSLSLSKTARKDKAKREFQKLKEDISDGYDLTQNISLTKLFNLYYKTLDQSKAWTKKKQLIYNNYISSTIGKKHISKIREMDVQQILSNMQKNGLSPRTQKSVLEVLKPMFKFAKKNKYLKENPIMELNVKVPSQKRIVINAVKTLNTVFISIKKLYKDDPLYQAIFLLGILSGRRKSEILHLKWENIDLSNNYYWIEDTKNDEKQKYPLPQIIKEQILLITDNKKGLVFKSPLTGGLMGHMDYQMKQLKKETGIENLSMHLMRNILVSAFAEQGVEAITLSGILGHKDVNTINKYLSINYYKSGQKGLQTLSEIVDTEVEVDQNYSYISIQ